MQWWADLWDNWAKTWGYSHWEWGSAADWFAALGTIGALFAALWVIRADRTRSQRQNAELVIIRADAAAGRKEADCVTRTVETRIHNAGGIAIPQVTVFVRSGGVVTHVDAADLMPGESEKRISQIIGADYPRFWAEIIDPRGKRLYKRLPSNDYVSVKTFANEAFGRGTLRSRIINNTGFAFFRRKHLN